MLHINLLAPAYENRRRYAATQINDNWDSRHWGWILPLWFLMMAVLVYLAI